MRVFKLKGKKTCAACDKDADFYVEGLDAVLCKECALELYKSLGTQFVPRSIPNVILRCERQTLNKDSQLEQIDADDLILRGKNNKESREFNNPEKLKTRRTKWQRKNRK